MKFMPLWGKVAWCHMDTVPQGCYALSRAVCDRGTILDEPAEMPTTIRTP